MDSWPDTPEAFIDRCMTAIGGRDALLGVATIKIAATRSTYDADGRPTTSWLTVYRKAGGCVRIEETDTRRRCLVAVVNGLSGEELRYERAEDLSAGLPPTSREPLAREDVARVKRTIRLYPRNFLAHADEHCFTGPLPGEDEQRPIWYLDLPVEDVRYVFDGESFLCRRLEDRIAGVMTFFADYRLEHGVLTPFIERRRRAGRIYQEETIETVEYNLPLDDALFAVQQPE